MCLWIDEKPAVSVWLSEIITGNISGILTVEKYWNEKVETTSPKLTDKFFINNTEEKVEKIKEWFIQGKEYFFIKAESSLEATLLLIAVMKNIDIEIEHKVILIKDRETWNKVISLDNKNIILVPVFPIDDDISCPNFISAILPISKFTSVSYIDTESQGDIEVLKILTKDSSEFLSKLEEWTKMEDFPIINIGNVYRVVLVQDMWLFLTDKIKKNDIENLKK